MQEADQFLSEVLSRYDYPLVEEQIANEPVFPRDHSKLLVLNRSSGDIADRHFYDLLEILTSNDVLVLNETKVFAARLLGKKKSGGKVELLLIKQEGTDLFTAISKPGLKSGQELFFPRRELEQQTFDLADDLSLEDFLQAQVVWRDPDSAKVKVQFNLSGVDLLNEIDRCGLTPLPPYIKPTQSEDEIKDEYQTVYAKNIGSAAAPTAGLHFTDELLAKLIAKGVQVEKITLHVGLGTFAKLTSENLQNKILHSEYYEISQEVAVRLNEAKQKGRRIIAVGTTSTRSLESATIDGKLQARAQETKIFIDPPYQFQFVDALLTNFHLPKSSLLMLVSAFCSFPNTEKEFTSFLESTVGLAYSHALQNNYRFFSFGDAMFIS